MDSALPERLDLLTSVCNCLENAEHSLPNVQQLENCEKDTFFHPHPGRDFLIRSC
jgi:hypothetical protein